MTDIKVLIVDDMPQIMDYFTMIVNNEAGMKVVGTASTGSEAVLQAQKLKPDVILMDIQMETDTAGIDAVAKISQLLPDIKIIMLTIHGDDENIMSSYVAGATDFIIKTASVVEVITAIREAVDCTSVRPVINKKIVDEMVKLRTERDSLFYVINLITRLTPSEFEVLKFVYNGSSYRQIAKIRQVEEGTIRSLVNKILKKMSAKSMRELVDRLRDLNIIEHIELKN